MNATALNVLGEVRHDYRILFEIGRGGMARVFLAESLVSGIGKLVVLKVLKPEFCASSEIRAAFRREAELSAQMNHPNVVQVLAVVDDADSPVIIMEYLDGVPLSALLKRSGGQLPLELRVYVLSQVLAGLHHFHELRDLDGTLLDAVHRDVSPQNIMVLHDGPIKVLDFGIAKVNAPNGQVTRTGTIKGKLQYMAPEQMLGSASIDRRADIFAVGVLLWEAVANRRMWEGKTEVELLQQFSSGALPRLRDHAPDAASSLISIVERATALDRERRYSTAREMQTELEGALAQAGWRVQPRDISSYMVRHFGARRHSQQVLIRNALREQRDSGPPTVRTSEARLRTRSDRPSHAQKPTDWGSDSVALPPSTGRLRRWGWLLAITVCLTIAIWGMLRRGATRHELPNAQSASELLTLEITVIPHEAEIYLDGKLLSTDHFTGRMPVSADAMTIDVSAPGYLTARQQVTLRKDTSLRIALERAAVVADQTDAGRQPSSNSTTLKAPSPRARTSERSAVRAARKPSGAVGSSPRGCQPPYTFSIDGIKTYKPECF